MTDAQNESEEVDQSAQALRSNAPPSSCGYRVESDHHPRWWRAGYFGELELTNVSGERAHEFEVFADLGGTAPRHCVHSDCEAVEGGYLFSAPPGIKRGGIRRGETHHILFSSREPYAGVKPYVLSINGVRCDQVPPEVTLAASQTFVPTGGVLTLSADARDDVAIRKVVFERDGVVLGVDTEAPYSWEIPARAGGASDTRHTYTATAYDPSGNRTLSNGVRVLLGGGQKFFGTAPDNTADYTHLLRYFNQLTPGNAGKWGSVEATRNQMDWAKLDTAYAFARDNGIRFKLHTLIWGQQQPGWMDGLTQAEQLQEIEQWIAAVAQRYPDVEMVDVVNEPLHAVPSYSAALGGAGSTGWDWVIRAFELARKYFPRAELLLNDYNVEALESFTTDYLKVIDVLNQRGLIDGIGLQAHFLERAELPIVATNLDRLAATGLPLYVSELDVNFANDARQAQRMRELFTLFWQHPSVVGVTHWGHLQGSTWRTDAYLVRSDGSTRPALDWINCFRAGGTDCSVPEYVPEPRIGDATSITLQAEDYDAAQGVLALGDVVAYTDDGDWQSFSRVRFDSNWDTLSVTYAKGNPEPGSVSVHLGSLESEPLATVTLAPTGGWGTSKTISVPISPILATNEQDLFVRYNGGPGVGNLDRIRLGAPAGSGPNRVSNSDFEVDTSGWFTWDGTLSTSEQYAVSGKRSLRLSGRSGNGPAATSLTGLVGPGKTYDVSLWTTISGADAAEVNITQKITCDGTESYNWLVNPTTVQAGQWTELRGSLTIPECNLGEVLIYAEGPAAAVDLFLDHVSVRAQQSSNLIENGGFEAGIAGWSTWNGTASQSTVRAHSGTSSLLIGNRTDNAPAATNLTSVVKAGGNYQVSFWVAIGGAESANVNLTKKIVCNGQDATYSWIANPTAVADGAWVELQGTLDVPNCELGEVTVYAEGPAAGVDLYVDDVKVFAPTISNLLADGSFESSTDGWFTWGGGNRATTADRAHGGTKSLLLSGRTGNSPLAKSLLSLVKPGTSYQVSVWTTIAGAASANVNLTQKIGCDGSDSYSWLANPTAVTEGEWVKLSGTLSVPSCSLTDVLVYAEGPAAGVDVYLDDAVVSP
ncbi:MAG TPA: endo-1,4-beta-xylanase [Polyangiaceae bacterium]|nr:endo-1,4-beta-xylanase [Polyangiaceae bacterium]